VKQLALNFDLGFLQDVPGTRVRQAVLRYTESRDTWRDDAKRSFDNAFCVEGLGRATEEWQGRASNDFPTSFALDKVQGHTPGVREWFVTQEIRDQWIDGTYPPLGFVLLGGRDSLSTRSYASCVSELSNITLEITYEFPQ
jgi:hypothetical protein